MNIPDCCNYTTEWLTGFKHHHSIQALRLSDEHTAADIRVADIYIMNFTKIIDKHNHRLEQVKMQSRLGYIGIVFPLGWWRKAF